MSKTSVELEFLLSQTSMLRRMLQKNGTVLATGDRIYGLLNRAYITVMSMGKYYLPLQIFMAVLILRAVDARDLIVSVPVIAYFFDTL